MGHVNRVLCGVALQDTSPPGTALLAEGKEVGRITSAAYSAALGRMVALAIVKRAWAVVGKPLETAVGSVEVVRFPLAS
jgi:glycine cleavage system aminomethyltransferase T